jgi:hypothetical protein
MKALLYAATFAVIVATPVLSQESVSLVGTWTGQRDRIAKVEGRRGGLATLVITEQQVASSVPIRPATRRSRCGALSHRATS